MGLNILITGGAGFLGSHLADKLIAEGHYVLCLDDLSTGREENLSVEGHLIVGDVVDYDFKFDCIFDRVYHLACPASPVWYQADPVGTMETAFLGSLNVLEMAKEHGARVLLASTSEVYGDPQVHPQGEDYWGNVNSWGPRACYDEGKRAMEALAWNYKDVRIARIFNTYGPRMRVDDGRAVSNFITQMLQGEPLTMYGDGSQTRSFCYVDDTVDGLIALMESEVSCPVNIGNPEEVKLLDLARMVIENMVFCEIVFKKLPVDDPVRRCPDITMARQLGWEPKVCLEEGLRRTVEYFKSELIWSKKVGHA